jgi:hypothetical protein
MKKFAIAFVMFAALLCNARSMKADPLYTINFTFESYDGTASAYGNLSGFLTWLSNPSDLNLFEVEEGFLSLSVNAPGPFITTASDTVIADGLLEFDNSGLELTVQTDSFGQDCAICFVVPESPSVGGGLIYLNLEVSGAGGLYSGDFDAEVGPDSVPYGIEGTFTLTGQVGNYDLTTGQVITPEPSPWLLLASGLVVIGLLLHRRSHLAANVL